MLDLLESNSSAWNLPKKKPTPGRWVISCFPDVFGTQPVLETCLCVCVRAGSSHLGNVGDGRSHNKKQSDGTCLAVFRCGGGGVLGTPDGLITPLIDQSVGGSPFSADSSRLETTPL